MAFLSSSMSTVEILIRFLLPLLIAIPLKFLLNKYKKHLNSKERDSDQHIAKDSFDYNPPSVLLASHQLHIISCLASYDLVLFGYIRSIKQILDILLLTYKEEFNKVWNFK